MRDSEIRIGETYRIRGWFDMAYEFGIWDGEIKCDANFIEGMKPLCGMMFTVKSVRDSNFGCYKVYEPEEPGFERWIITAHMLEPIEEEVVQEPSEDLFSFLFQLRREKSVPSNKPKIILPLFDGGVTDIDYEAGDNHGCPTCDYGSSYVDDFTVELTRFRIGIHINSMYNHFVSEGWLMRRLLMADHGMTEGQFVTWLKAVLDDHFMTDYEFHEAERPGRHGKTDPPTFCVYDKTTGKTETREFMKFDEQEYLKRLRRERYENENG